MHSWNQLRLPKYKLTINASFCAALHPHSDDGEEQHHRKKARCVGSGGSVTSEGELAIGASSTKTSVDLNTPTRVASQCGKGMDAGDTISTDASTGTTASLEHTNGEAQDIADCKPACSGTLTPSSVLVQVENSEVVVSQELSYCLTSVNQKAEYSEEVNEVEEEYEYGEIEFDPYAFIKTLPPLSACVPPRNEFLLPRLTRHSMKKKTLVLDLDETLVHSTLDGSSHTSDFVFPVTLGPVTHMVAVRKRPHLNTFLSRVSDLYEVVVFTASQQVYAEQLLDIVDPKSKWIRHRVYRDSCVVWEGNYLKDLTVLGRDLAHTIIIDNSPQAFGFQLENGVPIESWYDDDSDQELLRLLPFLEEIAHVDDVRPHISNKFGLKNRVEAAPDILYLEQ